ncbi:hypothetical protein [Pseudonocardia sp. NPDC049635]|uniref:hypothetical protein n=1 Tax=Pseudonocardia sp. NPDC049635 TaxID=3155506 RepID=UPI0033FF85EB
MSIDHRATADRFLDLARSEWDDGHHERAAQAATVAVPFLIEAALQQVTLTRDPAAGVDWVGMMRGAAEHRAAAGEGHL